MWTNLKKNLIREFLSSDTAILYFYDHKENKTQDWFTIEYEFLFKGIYKV